jgi:O-Antigen ligase
VRSSGVDDRVTVSSVRDDRWPRTPRVLPWLLAAFLCGVYLLPLDSSQLAVSLPVDPKLDRVFLVPIVMVWIAALLVAGEPRTRVPWLGGVGLALGCWVVISVLSVVFAYPQLVSDGEFALALKRLALLAAFVVFFLMVVSGVRRSEVDAFVTLWICLAVVTAIGALWTYRTGFDVFRTTAQTLMPGFVSVSLPFQAGGAQRIEVVGPALHGLALTTMLVMPVPFALQRILDATEWRPRIAYSSALVLIAIAAVTTGRRSAIIVPIVLITVLGLYRPRAMLRLSPLLLVFVAVSQAIAPAALTTLRARLTGDPGAQNSTSGRTSDYSAVLPDIVSHPILGRGFGSYDPQTYRILDNQFLVGLIETGAIGLLAFIGFLVAAWVGVHRDARRGDSFAIATAAAIAAFAISCLLYDALSFVQAAYLLFFVMALATIRGGRLERQDHQGVRWTKIANRRGFLAATAGIGLAVGGLSVVLWGRADQPTARVAVARVTLRIDTVGEVVATDARYVRTLSVLSATMAQFVGSGGVTSDVARRAGVDVADVRGVSSAPRIEQLSKTGQSLGGQRASAILDGRAPVLIEANVVQKSPLVIVTVRASKEDAAARLASSVAPALNARLRQWDPRVDETAVRATAATPVEVQRETGFRVAVPVVFAGLTFWIAGLAVRQQARARNRQDDDNCADTATTRSTI